MKFLALLALLPALALAAPTPAAEDEISDLAARGPATHTGVRIVVVKNGKCLSTVSKVPVSGVPVYSVDCSQARTWDIYQNGAIALHDYPQFVLDAGSNPNNGVKLKVWQSYPGLYQQTWTTTSPDRRVVKFGLNKGNQCIDEGNDGPQTWQCYDNNPNQVFRTETPY